VHILNSFTRSKAGAYIAPRIRSPAYLISAYTKRHALVTTFYTTVNMMRTIEDLSGLHHLSMNTANADPMLDVFSLTPDLRPYDPILPGSLCKPPVDPQLIPECSNKNVPKSALMQNLHDGAWWQAATKQFDFSKPDALDSEAFNRLLWKGVMGERRSYPTERSGKDLRGARSELLRSRKSE
jgi:DNA-binding beta-propeller fold protein YncE